MSDDLEEQLEVTQALLRQARADRDRLQRRLLQLEYRIRHLRRIPFLTSATKLQRRLRPARPAAEVPPVPVAAGPLTPGAYLDVTTLTDPARTGIARVVVRLAQELGYGLVAMVDGSLVHDAAYYEEIHGTPAPAPVRQRAGQPLVPGPGVTVVNAHIQLRDDFRAWQTQITALRAAGGRYVQIVHDLLPVTLPDFFDLGMRMRFPEWLAFVAAHADLILTDSEATRAELCRWLAGQADLPAAVRDRTGIEVCRLGCDFLPIARSAHSAPSPGKRVLVIGTVEPRKALDVVVAAVCQLRGRGDDVRLTVVGKHGWADEALVAELLAHSREGWLRWLTDADDRQLARCYAEHDLLVAASRGEGYGLPVAEATAAGLPALARDLPVFRELLGDAGTYFHRDRDLTEALAQCLAHPPAPAGQMPRRWSEAAQELDRLVSGLGVG